MDCYAESQVSAASITPRIPKNTRRNATGNSHNIAPLFFNPMSHVASNA
jgi:hypothetical protein